MDDCVVIEKEESDVLNVKVEFSSDYLDPLCIDLDEPDVPASTSANALAEYVREAVSNVPATPSVPAAPIAPPSTNVVFPTPIFLSQDLYIYMDRMFGEVKTKQKELEDKMVSIDNKMDSIDNKMDSIDNKMDRILSMLQKSNAVLNGGVPANMLRLTKGSIKSLSDLQELEKRCKVDVDDVVKIVKSFRSPSQFLIFVGSFDAYQDISAATFRSECPVLMGLLTSVFSDGSSASRTLALADMNGVFYKAKSRVKDRNRRRKARGEEIQKRKGETTGQEEGEEEGKKSRCEETGLDDVSMIVSDLTNGMSDQDLTNGMSDQDLTNGGSDHDVTENITEILT